MKLNILVLGSGGRENALAWKISHSPALGNLYCLPGNPGTSEMAVNIPGKLSDFKFIADTIAEKGIDMVVVGPEEPLVKGIRDYLEGDSRLGNLMIIGPDKAGAALEGSKEFAKKFMDKYSIPTASYASFTEKEYDSAISFLRTLPPPYVLKADGLAAGKGVLIINDFDEAAASLKEMFGGKFQEAGNTVVIEQFLSGIEASAFILTDGEDYLILPEAKDYKRIGDGDTGLNTGGMGAVSPVPFFDDSFRKKVEERIIIPTVRGLKEEGFKYRGFLFIGLMNCGGDPYVIEYNVRMGDPETESVMVRIKSDLLAHLKAAACGELSSQKITVTDETALTLVAVSGGYPEAYKKGFEISLPSEKASDTVIFHSGTAFSGGKVVTSGGRVLTVTALGGGIESAREKAYKILSGISFEGISYRNDIGKDLMTFK